MAVLCGHLRKALICSYGLRHRQLHLTRPVWLGTQCNDKVVFWLEWQFAEVLQLKFVFVVLGATYLVVPVAHSPKPCTYKTQQCKQPATTQGHNIARPELLQPLGCNLGPTVAAKQATRAVPWMMQEQVEGAAAACSTQAWFPPSHPNLLTHSFQQKLQTSPPKSLPTRTEPSTADRQGSAIGRAHSPGTKGAQGHLHQQGQWSANGRAQNSGRLQLLAALKGLAEPTVRNTLSYSRK